jgi:drug/metabolite transporter (DMT)-like permease
MAPVGTLFVTLACGLAALLLGGRLSPLVPRVMVPYIVCFVYIFFSCAIDISIAVQKQPDYSFNPVCAVLVTEGIKLCLSTTVYAASFLGSTRRVVPAEFSFSDMLYMAVPSAIYSVNNILVFHAIQQNSMSDFGIFRDTMILWTASLWRFVFKVPLGRIRLLGISVVFMGLVVNKVASTLSSGEITWRFLWVVAMTLCNSAGSVANEYALKRNSGLDINVQNMLLYIFCTLFTAVILLLTDPQRFSGSLSTGFSSQTWLTIGLQSIVGLLIARLLKYSDAVMKSIATCLRGPLVVLTAPLFTHVPTTAISILSAVIVATGCLTYLTQGPISAAGRDPAGKK